MQDKQSYYYQLTINNPIQSGFSHDEIKKLLMLKFPTCEFACMADEKGSCYHTHIFVAFTSRVRFSTIKKHFSTAHIVSVKGTVEQNIEYIQKSGKWKNSEKHDTQIPNTYEEIGSRPKSNKGKNRMLQELYELIVDGYNNAEIIAVNQDYIKYIHDMDRIRTTYMSEKFKNNFRSDLKVIYVYGETGTFKTSSILTKHGCSNVYRVTTYKHPFDGYSCQSIIMFDEFRSQIPIADMLLFLDIYPTELPSRYNNKFACYNTVYLVSNWHLHEQYTNIQSASPETWKAFLRRISEIHWYKDNSIYVYDFNKSKLCPQSLINITEDSIEADKILNLSINFNK